MSIRMINSCFIHIPRTGGLWLEKVIEQLGIRHQILRGDIDSHFSLKQLPSNWKRLNSFTFIRHPLDWVRSRWSHALEIDAYKNYRHYGIHREFDICVRPTLQETIETILKLKRRLVTRTYKYMTQGIDTIIATEDLYLRLPDYLKEMEKLSEEQLEIITNTDPINSTSKLDKYEGEVGTIDEELQSRFLESEKEALKLWEGC